MTYVSSVQKRTKYCSRMTNGDYSPLRLFGDFPGLTIELGQIKLNELIKKAYKKSWSTKNIKSI